MNPNSTKNFDAIVLGAGSIGAPTAYYLAKKGLKVLVLESVPSVGQGSNKRAIGGIRATHSDPAKISLCLRSIEIFPHSRRSLAMILSGTVADMLLWLIAKEKSKHSRTFWSPKNHSG